MKRTVALFLLAASLLIAAFVIPTSPRAVVFIGDSETSGRPYPSELDPGTWTSTCAGCYARFPSPAFWMLGTDHKIKPAREPLDGTDGQVQPNGDGQSADIAQPGNGQAGASYAGETMRLLALAEPGDWLAINCSKGRTTANYWSPQPPGYSGYQMGHYHLRRAMFGVLSERASFEALVVYLGINDAKLNADADAFEARMRALAASWRTVFGPDLRIYFVRIHPQHPLQATNAARWAKVHAAVTAIASDPLLEPTYLVDAPNGQYLPVGHPNDPGGTHLAVPGHSVLAGRLKTAIRERRDVLE
jgi:hypothetical protein